MKKKHANAGMTLYADYVVPVYNLNTDARFLATYENDEACVDIWAAKAKLNDEY